MKLVVIIPAYNEEKTIGVVIREIPRNACSSVSVAVVDDGSTDGTVKEAKKSGADKIISFEENRGLARAFSEGLAAAVDMGADIVVNIDADGQYDGAEIPKLIEPIVKENADIVLGSRFLGDIEYMPLGKKAGNIIATMLTRFLSGAAISDAQTGFRAFSKEAALRLNIMSNYTYVQETIIQAVSKGLRIAEVPCTFRKREGKSRLIPNILGYAKKAGLTILKTYLDYKPMKVFLALGGSLFLFGLLTGIKVLVHFYKTGLVSPYIPSTLLTVVLLILGFQIIVLGLIADMIGTNRRIQEEILYRLKKK